MQLDILLHEIPHDNSDLLDLSVTPVADLGTKPESGVADGPPVMEAA